MPRSPVPRAVATRRAQPPTTRLRALAATAFVIAAAWGASRAHAFAVPDSEADAGVDRFSQAAAETSDRLIVHYRAGTAGARAQRLAPESRAIAAAAHVGIAARTERRNAFGAHLVRLDRALTLADATRLARHLETSDWTIDSVEVDRVLHPLGAASDPLYGSQWDLFEAKGGIDVPGAWDLAKGSGVVVAVIDTGVRPHADLVDNLLPGWDFVADAAHGGDGDGRDPDASDPGDGHDANFCGSGTPAASSSWHGTHVAGTVAARADNGLGVSGVAPAAQVMPVRVLGRCGGYTSDIADAIVWASGGSVPGVASTSTPARVLNLSLGGPGACGSTLASAVNAARARGAIVVVAAGNSSQDAANFNPANCAGVTSVAAVNRAGARASYSNFGASVTLAAPGGGMSYTNDPNGILSTWNDGQRAPGNDTYATLQGTSMAAPHVAGVAALMMSRDAALTGDEAMALMRATSHAAAGGCASCGAGIVDAALAVRRVALGASVATRVNEVEPNGDRAHAQALDSLPMKVNGTLSATNDVDVYAITVPGKGSVAARLLPGPTSAYSVAVLNAAGTQVAAPVVNAAGWPVGVTATNAGAAAARYFLVVRWVSGASGVNGRYTLEAAPK